MRSLVSTWFSRRLARFGVATFLAIIVVGSTVFTSGALLHPPKAHAASSALINIPVQYRPIAKGITNCILQAALGLPIIYIGAAPAAFIEGGIYLGRAARIALMVNNAIQAELRIEQIVSVTRVIAALSKVDNGIIGTVTAGNCLGIIAFNVNNFVTNWVWGDSDPVGAAAALAADANVLCRNLPGTTIDTTTLLCQNPDGSYVEPDGTPVGSTPCALTPGTAVDSASRMCSDFGGPSGTDAPTYYGPYGDKYGQCKTGYPVGDGATCTDGNGNLYAPDGTSLNPPNQPLDDCTNYLLGQGSADPCDYTPLETAFTPPPTDTPTPSSNDIHAGTYFAGYGLNGANFCQSFTISNDGSAPQAFFVADCYQRASAQQIPTDSISYGGDTLSWHQQGPAACDSSGSTYGTYDEYYNLTTFHYGGGKYQSSYDGTVRRVFAGCPDPTPEQNISLYASN